MRRVSNAVSVLVLLAGASTAFAAVVNLDQNNFEATSNWVAGENTWTSPSQIVMANPVASPPAWDKGYRSKDAILAIPGDFMEWSYQTGGYNFVAVGASTNRDLVPGAVDRFAWNFLYYNQVTRRDEWFPDTGGGTFSYGANIHTAVSPNVLYAYTKQYRLLFIADPAYPTTFVKAEFQAYVYTTGTGTTAWTTLATSDNSQPLNTPMYLKMASYNAGHGGGAATFTAGPYTYPQRPCITLIRTAEAHTLTERVLRTAPRRSMPCTPETKRLPVGTTMVLTPLEVLHTRTLSLLWKTSRSTTAAPGLCSAP